MLKKIQTYRRPMKNFLMKYHSLLFSTLLLLIKNSLEHTSMTWSGRKQHFMSHPRTPMFNLATDVGLVTAVMKVSSP